MERLRHLRKLTHYERVLLILFLFSLPLANPWVRGDGVGYYAYARALVVNGNLRFEPDWMHANESFVAGRVDKGAIRPELYTKTGYLDNHFTIGPALDWMPFLFLTHTAVRIADSFGAQIPANGFSRPYAYTMAAVTAVAGFIGLLFSFALARKYFPERWAFLATLGIWLASSLPVYMYFNPSWSHAHSAFAVALFFWYWDRTRGTRTFKQWALLGLISALMLNDYYLNAIFLLAPLLESAWIAGKSLSARKRGQGEMWPRVLAQNAVYVGVVLIGLLPTFITRWIIYSSPLASGYAPIASWNWASPVFAQVLFSSDHGLFSWTPILILASLGLIPLVRRDQKLGATLLACALAFYFVIASYPDWDGISSYGNRFFISLTPIFVLGLAASLAAFEQASRNSRSAWLGAAALTALLALWNGGFIFQWGMHMIPDRGAISWNDMANNQFRAVPEEMASSLKRYFTHRSEMMQGIEKQDLQQLREQEAKQEKGGS
ncbi:MAG TPA: hypothetical protein VGT03_06235 [Candidatus Acidoferrales bacterium]|nr:hypothetical protein [Candidatus Acidoferrales bacterium]